MELALLARSGSRIFLRGAVLAAVATVTLQTGCGDWRDGLEVWHGEHIDFYHDPTFELCGGTRAYVDAYVPFVATELGLAVPEGIAFAWLDDQAYEDFDACAETSGCQTGRRALSRRPVFLHEVAHAVAQVHGLNEQPFFTEGLAKALDWFEDLVVPSQWVAIPVGEEKLPDPRPTMELPRIDIPYAGPGSFVMFLLARHGAAPFVAFTRALGTSTDLATIRRQFRAAYGLDLDHETAEYMQLTPDAASTAALECVADSVRPYDCAMPEIAWESPDAWSHTQQMDCADEAVVGGSSADWTWPSLHAVTLEVPMTGTYTIAATGDGDFQAQLGACFGCPWQHAAVTLRAGGQETVHLEAGSYYVRIRVDDGSAPEVRFTLNRTP
ncbi:hypothetical protein [Nannocystis pusilla]|uniref:Lipoprotein n=1 Tax=Nannocystis pusilla TaxID=889268 RepID=A0ABS7TL16_9BACT|nr:hypothetical protein [Nannocystis pusilla]MBZ5708910.1 hypothetical protein [Nannocystis pusilla]